MENVFAPKVAIIGRGRVGCHLHKALSPHTPTYLIDSRSLKGLPDDTDLCIISVSDNAVTKMAEKLHLLIPDVMTVHTSGSLHKDVLSPFFKFFGVIYPLQTFSLNSEINYSEIPILIEGSDSNTTKILRETASMFSTDVRTIDSELRKVLHISAVLSCNFSNHLMSLADILLRENGLDYSILLPLLKEMTKKLETMSPFDAQTGPAARGDSVTVKSHLEYLKKNPQLHDIYVLLSNSISELHSRIK